MGFSCCYHTTSIERRCLPRIADNTFFLHGLSSASGKPVQLTFDGGRLTSDAGVMLLAEIEWKLGTAVGRLPELAGHRPNARTRGPHHSEPIPFFGSEVRVSFYGNTVSFSRTNG